MATEKELNAAILKKTLMIQEKFPELSKYIEEMPITIPVDNPEITLKNLTDYCNSLDNLIEKYAESHWYTEGPLKVETLTKSCLNHVLRQLFLRNFT